MSIDHTHSDSLLDSMTSFVLFLFAGLFDLASKITPDDAYKWFFRLMSCVSLALIMYINYHKAKAFFKKRKHEPED